MDFRFFHLVARGVPPPLTEMESTHILFIDYYLSSIILLATTWSLGLQSLRCLLRHISAT